MKILPYIIALLAMGALLNYINTQNKATSESIQELQLNHLAQQ